MGNPLGVFDEIFNPTKHQSSVELSEQKELKVQASNADPNRIHIDLSKK